MNYPSPLPNSNGHYSPNHTERQTNNNHGSTSTRARMLNYRNTVCVVGAGAAGICALRHFTGSEDKTELFESVVCYEQTDSVGGTWNYSEKTGHDKNGLPIHSSMYRNLKTNLPMSLMQYPDYKANCSTSFVHHTEVLRYLVDYAHHFEVVKYIKFNHQIVNITRNQSNTGWLVLINDIFNRRLFQKTFDIIILANGRYSVPFWPEINHMDRFKGRVLHSHDYRNPEPYAGQRVAVIGGQSSGIDISIELLAKAKQIILVNRSEFQYKNLPDNVVQINANAKEMGPNSITFILNNNNNNSGKTNGTNGTNGTIGDGGVEGEDSETKETTVEFEIDTLIFATGYQFSLNCLDQDSCGIKINQNGTIDGLFRHYINIKHPSMLVMAVCQRIIPFPFYHLQLMYYLRILKKDIELPSVEEMWSEVRQDIVHRKSIGLREKDRHLMKVEMMEDYLRQLVREGQLEPLPNVIFTLYADLYRIRCENILHYKENNYELIDDDHYVQIGGH